MMGMWILVRFYDHSMTVDVDQVWLWVSPARMYPNKQLTWSCWMTTLPPLLLVWKKAVLFLTTWRSLLPTHWPPTSLRSHPSSSLFCLMYHYLWEQSLFSVSIWEQTWSVYHQALVYKAAHLHYTLVISHGSCLFDHFSIQQINLKGGCSSEKTCINCGLLPY